jgi:hypothetical protein
MRIVTSAIVCLCLGSSASAADLRVGAAVADITPPKGTPMAGYYSARLSEGVHDPLHAKAIVLEKDGTKAALVALDLISTTPGLVDSTRKQIEKETGIPGGNVMISATHSHTGPELADRGRRAEMLGANAEMARAYLKGLPERIAESVRLANERLAAGRVAFGSGREDGLTFNRRFHMRDGSVGWNPGKRNPNIIRPAGPTDPSVPVVCFDTADGKPIALYVNFAMHLDTVGGLQVSADYPYTLSKSFAAVKGEGVVTVFTIGTAGDLNHVNVNDPRPQKGHGEAARIGTILAANVLRTCEQLQPASDGPLRVSRETVELPLPNVSADDVTAAREVVDQLQTGKQRPAFLKQVQAFKALDVSARLGKPLEVEVQVISIGDDIAWVSLPGEIFVDLGLAIKHGSPFRQTVIAELANGSIGYVPTKKAYSEGNYEVVSARCAEGSGEKLVESAVRQLRKLYPAVAKTAAPKK